MEKTNAYNAFKKYLIEVLKLDKKTAYSYASMARGFAKQAGQKLESLTLNELYKIIRAFIGQKVGKRSDYSRRSALRAYLKFSKHLEKKSATYLPKRSEIGYERFLRNVYVRKTGEGEMLTVVQYLSYIRAFEKALGMYEGQIHTLSKWDVTRSVKKLEDIRKTLINSRHYLSAASTYEDYVAYTLGKYLPNVAA